MSFFLDRYCTNASSIPITVANNGPFETILEDEKKSIAPTKDEGFDTIIEQPVKLTILNRDRIEFNHQGLIVDGLILALSMLLHSDSDTGPLSHIHWIFTSWMKIKPNGRIIVIAIERDFEKLCETFKSKKTFEQFMSWMPKIFCKYFTFPIYTVRITSSNFSQLKRDETLIFSTIFYFQSLAASESLVLTSPFISQSLVQLNGANTTASNRHKKFFKKECNLDDSTIYFNSDFYFKMSKIGLLLLDFSSISEIPIAEINNIQMEQKFALCQLDYRTNQPAYFKQIEFVQYNDWKPEGKSISKFIGRYPLVQELYENSINDFSIGFFKDVHKKEIKSLTFGVILDSHHIKQFHSQNDFNNFVQYYQKINEYSVSNQMDYAAESINNERKRFSPKQSSRLSKSLEVGTSSPTSKPQATSTTASDGKTSDIYQFPATDMSISAICDYFGLVTFQKGRDMETQIYDVMVKLIPEKPFHFKLYSKCSSATEKDLFYRQEILMKQGKIVKGICTCPIGSQGKCKHVCASIISYVSIIANRNVGNEEKIEEKEKLTKSGSLSSQSESQLSESKVISQEAPSFSVKPEVSEQSQEPKKKKTLPSWMNGGSGKEKSQKSSGTSSIKDSKSEHIKKPKTSFFLYCDDHRDTVKEELGGKVAASEVAKELGARWKLLKEEEKQVYIDKHKELQNEYSEKKKEMKSKSDEKEESTSEKEESTTTAKKKIKKEDIEPVQEDDNDESFGDIFFSKPSAKTKSTQEPTKIIGSTIGPTKSASSVETNKEKTLQETTFVKKEQHSDEDNDESFGNIFFSKPTESIKVQKPTVTTEKPALNQMCKDFFIKPEPQSPKKRKLPSPLKPPIQDNDESDEDASNIFFSSSKKKKPNLEKEDHAIESKQETVKSILHPSTMEKKPLPNKLDQMEDSVDDATSIFFSYSKKKKSNAEEKVEPKQEKSIVNISTKIEKKETTKKVDRMEESDDEGDSMSIFFSKQTKKKPQSPIVEVKPTQQPHTKNVPNHPISKAISTTNKKDNETDDEEDVSFSNIFFSKSTKKPPPPVNPKSSPIKSTGANQDTKTKKVTSLKAMMEEFEF